MGATPCFAASHVHPPSPDGTDSPKVFKWQVPPGTTPQVLCQARANSLCTQVGPLTLTVLLLELTLTQMAVCWRNAFEGLLFVVMGHESSGNKWPQRPSLLSL